MLIAIIGENCVGKSTLANHINKAISSRIYSGKDYLRLKKSPSEALDCFKELLKESVAGENIIYLITEEEHIALLPEGAVKIVLLADIETIKERFKERMRGNLPVPLEKMLEAKHGVYDNIPCDMRLDGTYNVENVISELTKLVKQVG